MPSRGRWASLAGVTLLLAMVELNVEAEVAGPRSIVLRVGEQKSLPAQGIRSYSEGAPGFAPGTRADS